MAKFVYRMQSVLDVKLKLEEQEKLAFAAAKIKLDEEQDRLDALQNRKAEYEKKGRQLRMQKLDFLEIAANQTAVEHMEEKIEEQLVRVEDAQEALERERKALTQIMMERKAQEILREKAFEEFLHEINRAESKEVDELTSYVYGRAAQLADR